VAQFLVAPYSLFVSFALAIALIPPLYASHYLVYYAVRHAVTFISSLTGESERTARKLSLYLIQVCGLVEKLPKRVT
jgi:hypothetical protein